MRSLPRNDRIARTVSFPREKNFVFIILFKQTNAFPYIDISYQKRVRTARYNSYVSL